MATIDAATPKARIQEILNDEDGVTWTDAQMLRWFNEAQRIICSLAPRANPVTEARQLTANETKQSLGGASNRDFQLLDIHRNMGSDGSTIGDAITPVERGAIESLVPTWHSDTGETTIQHYVLDTRTPLQFWVYPRVHASTDVWVEMTVSQWPVALTDLSSDNIGIAPQFEPHLQAFVIYRCLIRGAQQTPHVARAAHWFNEFTALMTAEGVTDMQANPLLRQHLENFGGRNG